VENPQHSPVFRNGILTLVSPDGLITLARHNTDLTTLISKLPAQSELAKAPFPETPNIFMTQPSTPAKNSFP
jgi:hypothetical protein